MTHHNRLFLCGLFLLSGACAQGDVGGDNASSATNSSTAVGRDLGGGGTSTSMADMPLSDAGEDDMSTDMSPEADMSVDMSQVKDLGADMAPPCGGMCAPKEVCRQNVCEDVCAKAAASCGEVTDGPDTVACGACAGSSVCRGNACIEVCAPVGLVCGELAWSGQLASCGTCPGGLSCVSGQCVGAGWRRVSAGADATCATRSNGEVRCWGDGSTGQLGLGVTTSVTKPATVPQLASILDVDMESRTVCALDAQQKAWCWGQNTHLQIGDQTTSPRLAPYQVTAFNQPVTQVSVATSHICALDASGRASCIGYNAQGQLGDGTRDLSPTPKLVGRVGALTALELGELHSCALELDGRAKCWGYNGAEMEAGRLGTGQEISTANPTVVSQLPVAFRISAGYSHSCAVDQSLKVWCWGDNQYGQLGMSGIDKLFAAEIPTLFDAVDVFAGYQSTCAIDRARDLWCWGRNTYGQLGMGDLNVRRTPEKVPVINQIADVDLGQDHTCATTLSGELWCWGRNHRGQLGVGDKVDRLSPVRVE